MAKKTKEKKKKKETKKKRVITRKRERRERDPLFKSGVRAVVGIGITKAAIKHLGL